MKKSYQHRVIFCLYVFFLSMFSISIVLMPFTISSEGTAAFPPWISGILFWTGMIGIISTAIRISVDRRKNKQFSKKHTRSGKWGAVQFFQNKAAIVFDVLMFAAIILFILFNIVYHYYLQFISLAGFVFSFGMHCMLNDINYAYIKYMIRSGVSQ